MDENRDIVDRLRRKAEEYHEMCDNVHVDLLDAANEIIALRVIIRVLMIEKRTGADG